MYNQLLLFLIFPFLSLAGLPNGSVHSYIQEISKVVPKPNLHTLGVLFLPRGLGAAFNILVLLNL